MLIQIECFGSTLYLGSKNILIHVEIGSNKMGQSEKYQCQWWIFHRKVKVWQLTLHNAQGIVKVADGIRVLLCAIDATIKDED